MSSLTLDIAGLRLDVAATGVDIGDSPCVAV